MFLRVKARPARKAGNPNAIGEPIIQNMWDPRRLTAIWFYTACLILKYYIASEGPPLWSSSRSFWLLTQRPRVRLPALPNFLSSSGFGPGYTQPRGDK
jgi:hypothetical protein